jgi:hypothetical protein
MTEQQIFAPITMSMARHTARVAHEGQPTDV